MVQSFKEFLQSKCVFVFYETTDHIAAVEGAFLLEGGHTKDLGKNWSMRFDRAVAPNQQDHVDIMLHKKDASIIQSGRYAEPRNNERQRSAMAPRQHQSSGAYRERPSTRGGVASVVRTAEIINEAHASVSACTRLASLLRLDLRKC